MCDGSTNSAVREVELIYIRAAIHGEVRIFFVACTVVDRPTSANILQSILDATAELGITQEEFYKHLVCFSADGASVNFGCRTGIATELIKKSDWIIAFHCAAHRIELAIKDASKTTKYQTKVDELLLGLYLYYHNSSVMRGGLLKAREILNTQKRIPTRVGGTRWVQHTHTAVENILAIYPAIIAHLNSVTEDRSASTTARGKANGYLKLLRSRKMILWLHLLLDLTEVLQTFSKTIQKHDCLLSDVSEAFNCTMDVLCSYQTCYSPSLNTLLAGRNETDFAYHDITDLYDDSGNFEKDKETVLAAVIEALKSRFKDLNFPHIAAVNIVNVNTWPLQGQDQRIQQFGQEDVKILYERFQQPLAIGIPDKDVNITKLMNEWQSVKTYVVRAAKRQLKHADSLHIDSLLIWQEMWRVHGENYQTYLP
jgi:hypothetical protein